MEALGERKKAWKNIGLPGWNDYIQVIIPENKEAYLKYLEPTNEESNYKKYCAAVKWETRKIHRESLNRYISNTESDIYGAQNIACKIMKKLSRKEKDDFQ